jgi:hypothetical protein
MNITINNNLETGKPFYYIEYLYKQGSNHKIIINTFLVHKIDKLDYIKIYSLKDIDNPIIICINEVFDQSLNNYKEAKYMIDKCFATKDEAIKAGNEYINSIKE